MKDVRMTFLNFILADFERISQMFDLFLRRSFKLPCGFEGALNAGDIWYATDGIK
jgi:hypothetical protein